MGLFDHFKKSQKSTIKIEMHGFENGEEVQLKSYPIKDDWKKQLSIQLTINEQIKPLEDIMVGFAVALKHPQKIDDEILLLQSLIDSYRELKAKCYSLGPDYIDYMRASWEEVRQGKPDGPGYITRYETRLKYLKENYEELRYQETRHEESLVDLQPKLMSSISENQPILQSEIYKLFDISVKSDIRDMLYALEKEGKIKREKHGKSYLISI